MRSFIEDLKEKSEELEKEHKGMFITLQYGAYLYAFGKKNIKFFVQFACFERDKMDGVQVATTTAKFSGTLLHPKIKIVLIK